MTGGLDGVLSSGIGLAGAEGGVLCPVPAGAGWFASAGVFASGLERVRWERLVSRPCGPFGVGLRPAWTPAASQRGIRLPEAKGKRAQGRIGGQAGTPLPSVVSEVSNHKAPAERERRALVQAMGKAARLRKHRHRGRGLAGGGQRGWQRAGAAAHRACAPA